MIQEIYVISAILHISRKYREEKMKFEECYRGFIWADMEKFYNEEKQRPDKRIKTFMGKDKNGNDKEFSKMESYRQKKKLKTFDQVSNIPNSYNSIVGVLAPGIVLIDVDNAEQGEKLWEILRDMGIDCPVIETTKGYHFLFRDIYGYGKSENKFYTPIGIEIDIKLGNNGGLEFLTVAGEERKILNDTENIPDLPKFLYVPLQKKNYRFRKIEGVIKIEGADTRNNFLSAHKRHLYKMGRYYTAEEILEICSIIDSYMFYAPLPEEEFKRIMREENIIPDNEELYSDSIPLDKVTAGMFFNEKGRFDHSLMARYLKRNFNAIKILDNVHLYINGVYTFDNMAIEKEIFRVIPQLMEKQRLETIKSLNLICENREIDRNWVNFRNTLYNPITGEFKEHTPDTVTVNRIPNDYNPEADTSEIQKLMLSFVCEDEKLLNVLMEYAGHIFYPGTDFEKCMIITGERDSGKSTLTNYLREDIVGVDNTSNVPLEDFNDKFATYDLRGKMLNVSSELNGGYISDTAKFKQIISGDTIRVQLKMKNSVNIRPTAKHIFSTNDMVNFKDPTGAITKRIMIMPFRNNFSAGSKKRDPLFKEKLKKKENIEGFIKLAMDRLNVLMDRGYFEITDEMADILNNFDKDNNPILVFLEYQEELHSDKEWYIERNPQSVYSAYKHWMEDNGYRPVKSRQFSMEFCRITGAKSKMLWDTDLKRHVRKYTE